jgi:hypothetical protein
MAKRLFGIVTDTTGKPAAMIVNSLSKSASAQIAEARDEDGKVIELQAYSIAKTVSISGVTSADNPADCGSVITIGGKNYLIDKADQNESNTAFVDISISAQTADNADLTSIDGSTTAATSTTGQN